MMKLARVFQCFLFVNLVFVACLTNAQEVEDEREFNYNKNSENGPANWGEIHEEWKECGTGKMQSPIDMTNERVQIVSHLGRIKRNYKAGNATLMNRGHDMMIKWPKGAGYIEMNRTLYELKQMHWHSPSEHTVNGRRFDMEVHLVHQSKDNNTAVIGIMYKIGRPDSFLSMMERNLKEITHKHDVEQLIGIIDPKLIKLGSRKYYRYIGSLTTPPCKQNVIWTIITKVRTVTRKQVATIRDAVHDEAQANARPIQALHERQVHLYRPNDIVK